MFTRKPLSIAMAAVFGVASAGSMMSTAVHAQEATANDDQMIEEIVTTGSRIKRSTNTESQEIITFTAESMKLSGDISVSDALRSSTMNSIGSFRESSGSSAQSNATVNLRGVGTSRTLVLLNGRRTVGSPSLGGGGSVNLNMIPFSAVDRIEVIADGASAIYGSDAVAGVVNIILKRDYDGLMISGRYGDRSEDDGSEASFSILTGAQSDRGSVTFGIEYDRTDPIFDKDRDYTKASYSDLNGDGQITGYEETVGVSVYGYTLLNPDYEPEFLDAAGTPNPAYIPFDPNNRASWYVDPGANCVDGVNGYAGVMNADTAIGVDSGFYCGYAFALVSANRAGLERINTWVSAEYELTDSIDFYADAVLANNESFGRYAPPAASGPTIPGDARNDIGATYGYFRWTDIGTRDNVVNDTLTDVNLGLKGEVSDSISWDAGYTYSKYVSSSVGNYYLSYSGLAYNIANGIDDFDAFVANLKTTTLNDDRMEMQKLFGGVQFDMFDMAGGSATTYVGAEYFEIQYDALVDAQSEAGLVGGSAGNSASGYRDVSAMFAEMILPVTDGLEFDLAVRYDDYSDFGSATTYRGGATWVIPGFEALKLKASIGTGFRAPDLSDLYGATAFSAEFARDYWGCELAGVLPADCPRRQFSTYIGSNPNLDAEKSQTWSVGADFTFLESWVASISLFNLDMEDPILNLTAQNQLDVDYQTQGGNPFVTRNATGGVSAIVAGYQNGSTSFNNQALDLGLHGSQDTSFGMWGFGINSSYYINADAEVSFGTGELYNQAGTLGFPEWRTNMLLSWEMDGIFSSLNYDYIGESSSNIGDEKYDSWGIFNLAVGYADDDYGTVTVGANNLLNEEPILDPVTGGEVDQYTYSSTGRVIYISYSIEF